MSDENAEALDRKAIMEAAAAGAPGQQRMSVMQAQVAAIRSQALAASETMHAIAVQCDAFLLIMMMLNTGGAVPPGAQGSAPKKDEPTKVFGGRNAGE